MSVHLILIHNGKLPVQNISHSSVHTAQSRTYCAVPVPPWTGFSVFIFDYKINDDSSEAKQLLHLRQKYTANCHKFVFVRMLSNTLSLGRVKDECVEYNKAGRMNRTVLHDVLGKETLVNDDDITLVTQMTSSRSDKLYHITIQWSGK